MKLGILPVVALATLATSAAIRSTKQRTPLEVTLSTAGHSKVKAAVTNTGSQGYNLFYRGSLLDSAAPVDKLTVSGTISKARFMGARVRLRTTGLTDKAFVTIQPGQTVQTEVDLAELYDLPISDTYTVQATGYLRYAELNSTELSPYVLSYSSNKLDLDIDGAKAAAVPYAVTSSNSANKRTLSGNVICPSDMTAILNTTLSQCAMLAKTAADAAISNSSSTFSEYFKTHSSTVRASIAARFRAIATDCGSSSSNMTTLNCLDVNDICSGGVVAYTIPEENRISFCPIFYSDIPELSSTCHKMDRVTTIIHEMTHAPGVYSPGTEDVAYGYESTITLSESEAIRNADTYTLYANAVYSGC